MNKDINRQKEENETRARRKTENKLKEGYRKTEMFLVAHELHIALKHITDTGMLISLS